MQSLILKVQNFSSFLEKSRLHLHSSTLIKKEDINELIKYLVYLEREISDFNTEIKEEANTINKINDFLTKSRFEIVDLYERIEIEEAIVRTKEIIALLEDYLVKFKEKLDAKITKWNGDMDETFNESKIKKG